MTDFFKFFNLTPGPLLVSQSNCQLFTDKAFKVMYHQIQTQVHPDQMAVSQRATQDAGVAQELTSAQYSQAYQCLIDPLSRVRHWLELTGMSLEGQSTQANMELFEEQMQAQEILEGLKSQGSAAAGFDEQYWQVHRTMKDKMNSALQWFVDHQTAVESVLCQSSLTNEQVELDSQTVLNHFGLLAMYSRILNQLKDIR